MYMHTSMLWYIMIYYVHMIYSQVWGQIFRTHQTNADRGAPIGWDNDTPKSWSFDALSKCDARRVWWFITLSLKVLETLCYICVAWHGPIHRIHSNPVFFWGLLGRPNFCAILWNSKQRLPCWHFGGAEAPSSSSKRSPLISQVFISIPPRNRY